MSSAFIVADVILKLVLWYYDVSTNTISLLQQYFEMPFHKTFACSLWYTIKWLNRVNIDINEVYKKIIYAPYLREVTSSRLIHNFA